MLITPPQAFARNHGRVATLWADVWGADFSGVGQLESTAESMSLTASAVRACTTYQTELTPCLSAHVLAIDRELCLASDIC